MSVKKVIFILPVLLFSLECSALPILGPVGTAIGVSWLGTKIRNAGPGSCGPTTIAFSGTQDPDDDEFLYVTNNEFLAAEAGYKNSNKSNGGDGHAYECDNKHCQMNQVVTMPKGHVFKGKVINRQVKYQCSDPFLWEDKWIPVDDGYCYAGKTYGKIAVGKWTTRDLTKIDCSGFELTDPNGTKFKLLCREGPYLICKAIACPDGYKLDAGPGKCVLDNKVDPTPNPNPNPDPKPKLTCRQQRANGTPTGLACCDTGADADYIAATDQCVCKDATKEFKINEIGRGACVVKGQPAPEAKCECSLTAKAIAEAKATCGGNTSSAVATAITSIELECKDIAKCDAKKFAEYMDIINGAGASCVAPTQPVNDEAALKRIEEKVKSVEKRFGELDVSVWTTAEGNFNGARLASDSIAGVVLGTTGALITSNVVKKNQIKSGFEDIVCTVGGQTVGNYGDEISVGIK